MKNQAREGKFKLSVLEALWMVMIYTFTVMFVILIPFQFVIESIHFENIKVIIGLLEDIIIDIIIILIALKKVKELSNNNFKIKYINKFNYKLLFSIIFLMGGYYLLYESSLGMVINTIPKPLFLEEAFVKLFQYPYAAFISMVIIAPIFEEIFMRGIVLVGLLNRYTPKKAVIISALIFGVWHLNIQQCVDATLAGLILGIIYYKTSSLILCITAHMANNIITIIMEYVDHSFNMITFFVGVIIFIGSAMLFFRYLKELDEKLEINK